MAAAAVCHSAPSHRCLRLYPSRVLASSLLAMTWLTVNFMKSTVNDETDLGYETNVCACVCLSVTNISKVPSTRVQKPISFSDKSTAQKKRLANLQH